MQNKLGRSTPVGYSYRVSPLETEILNALITLDETVASIQQRGAKPELLPLFARIDSLVAQLPKSSAPDLLHYLHRKSYEKARAWLEGRAAETRRGSCH